ncbi:MAG TPA: 50S ribosomal protein L35 [Chloroflexota bacterium]|nr:50S ribosomal protein L35 [Chloroflexota bacterium]
MPKVKTHKGTAKRFKITGTGKVLRNKVGTNHRMHKSKSMQRKMKQDLPLHGADAALAKKMLPGLKTK